MKKQRNATPQFIGALTDMVFTQIGAPKYQAASSLSSDFSSYSTNQHTYHSEPHVQRTSPRIWRASAATQAAVQSQLTTCCSSRGGTRTCTTSSSRRLISKRPTRPRLARENRTSKKTNFWASCGGLLGRKAKICQSQKRQRYLNDKSCFRSCLLLSIVRVWSSGITRWCPNAETSRRK